MSSSYSRSDTSPVPPYSYKQALYSAQTARSLAQKANFPFTRPADYFAEMVKSDAHMERIRQRLLDESAAIKRSEEKRREREGKKFGKVVQMERMKERAAARREVEEKVTAWGRCVWPPFELGLPLCAVPWDALEEVDRAELDP